MMRRAAPLFATLLLALTACSTSEQDGRDLPPESQLPLGSENPCWGGKFPDDIASLEEQGISASDLLVDTRSFSCSPGVGRSSFSLSLLLTSSAPLAQLVSAVAAVAARNRAPRVLQAERFAARFAGLTPSFRPS